MRKIVITIVSILFMFGVAYAGFSVLLYDSETFDTSSDFTVTTQPVGLEDAENIGYGIYTDTDSLTIIATAQGLIGDDYIDLTSDTLAKASASGNYEIRKPTSDEITGFSQIRFKLTITPDTSSPAAADTSGSYSLIVTGY